MTKFIYLGSDVVSSSSSTPEVHSCIGLANSIVGQLDRVWRNRRLSLNTKLRLYTSLVQSVLLHGSETWTLTKADTARLQAFYLVGQGFIRPSLVKRSGEWVTYYCPSPHSALGGPPPEFLARTATGYWLWLLYDYTRSAVSMCFRDTTRLCSALSRT